MDFRNKDNIQMVLLDLDGTILTEEKKIGNLDISILQNLGFHGIKRVFATGRNLYSALKVLPYETPFDYLVFSSGAGVYEWKTKKLLFSSSIERTKVIEIEKLLKELKLNFSVHFPIPENHKYYYFKGNNKATDFEQRNSIYRGFNYELANGFPLDSATQFIVILKDNIDFQSIADMLPDMKVIRATSPIDGKSVWLEIFNTDVSKAKGGAFLCEKLNIAQESTLGIGNDYNDLDLLNWTQYSYIVENAPIDIRNKYNYCVNNQSNPLNYVIQKHCNA